MRYPEVYRQSAAIFAAACGAVGAAAILASQIRVENRFVILLAGWAPVWIGAALVGAVVATIAQRWLVQGACLVVCALGGWLLAPLYVAGPGIPDPGGPTLRVMQANIKVGQADPTELTTAVRERGVDVLTVQELTDEAIDALHTAGLDDLLPHRFVVPLGPGGLGGGVYSRYPLSDTRVLDGYLSANLAADIDVGLREPVALLAVHPAPAYLFPAEMWASELRAVGAEMTAVTNRDNIVVAGDFNASWPQRQYRDLLVDGYLDAADQTGAGLVPTMPAHRRYPAVTGIDRIVTKGAVATSLDRILVDGSDHHGVVADIRLARD